MKKYSNPFIMKEEISSINERVFLIGSGPSKFEPTYCYEPSWEQTQAAELGRYSVIFDGLMKHSAAEGTFPDKHCNHGQAWIITLKKALPTGAQAYFNGHLCEVDPNNPLVLRAETTTEWPRQNYTDSIGLGDITFAIEKAGWSVAEINTYMSSFTDGIIFDLQINDWDWRDPS